MEYFGSILFYLAFESLQFEWNETFRLAGAQLVILLSQFLMMFFKLPFDLFPICNTLSILAIIISVHRNEFFGIMELGHEWVFDQMEDAFVIVDEMYGYRDSNSYAKKIFSELNSKQKNAAVSEELYEIFTSSEKIIRIQGQYYTKKVCSIYKIPEMLCLPLSMIFWICPR